MCGIVGGVQHIYLPEERKQALQLISHRGPDGTDMYEDDRLWLGHARLSIQDLSADANQPMKSEDGNYMIVFNGEIYNHWELRKTLQSKGYRFRTTSDTESLLYAYIAFGKDCLHLLNGIFAFTIYDKRKQELFIARDQMGVKPLYYYHHNDEFLFCSELKGFTAFKSFDKTPSVAALYQHLLLLYAPGTETAFQHVKKLQPGHYLTIQLNSVTVSEQQRYYQIPFNGVYQKQHQNIWIDQLADRLSKAVNSQMLSDVPIAFFLSGGLDSSLLAAMIRKQYPGREMIAYTIDTKGEFSNEGFEDDLPFARKIAKNLAIDLRVIPSDNILDDDFDKMIWVQDEPQADVAAIFVNKIAQKARQDGFKILMGGTGADDVFSGYRRHSALRFEAFINRIPQFIKSTAPTIIDKLPNSNTARRAIKLLGNLEHDSLQRRIAYHFWMDPNRLSNLFLKVHHSALPDPFSHFANLLNEIPEERDALNQMLFWEMKTFLPDHNLHYTDKAAMSAGIEVRVPYLDKSLIELSTTIPSGLKMKGSQTKYLLKQVAERYLPKEIIYRKKTGFGAPVRNQIRHEMKAMVQERLLDGALYQHSIFNREEVAKLIEDNYKGNIDASYSIRALMAIESWLRQFVL